MQWNGTALTTQFVNDTTLAAAVPYANVAAPGTAQITVANSTTGGGGGVSNSATFTITNAMPGDTVLTALALTALTPNYVADGGSSATGGIQGEGFYSGSIVNVNGSPRPTAFKAHNALTYTLTAADIATAGTTLQITVTNPAPGGGTTAALPLAVGGTVSGTLTFEGIASIAPAQNVTFTFRPTDNSAVQTRFMAVPPNGIFSVGGLPRKTYTLHIKGDKYLAANISVNVTSAAQAEAPLPCPPETPTTTTAWTARTSAFSSARLTAAPALRVPATTRPPTLTATALWTARTSACSSASSTTRAPCSLEGVRHQA